MDRLIVVYDSCVLYPAPLRDLLMHLALTDLYQAKWTESRDCIVIGYEALIPTLSLPDPNDHHVLAAASLI